MEGRKLRYAVISDIHSNLEGLQAVLHEAEKAEAEALLCCGDIIGYNANPNECVDLVRDRKARCIRGNHERGLQDLEERRVPNMNAAAMEALYFTADRLSGDRRDWLISLPDMLAIDDAFYIFHGSPNDPDEYIFDTFEAAYAFRSLIHDYPPPANMLCFIGHTHICTAYAYDSDKRKVGIRGVSNGEIYAIQPGAHYMFNAGSCGQYRGGLPIATMIILDTEEMSVDFRFLEYDYHITQEKIRQAGLPDFLAQRLAMGQ
jgi:predicted phosphodiesterase